MDVGSEILKNSIQYLYKLSESIPKSLPTPKCIYASKSRILELKGNVFLPKKITKSTIRCQRCCLSFHDYPPSTVIAPKKKVDKFTKKLVRKSEGNKCLTPYQKKRLERVKHLGNISVKKICTQCKHETSVIIETKSKDPIIIDDTLEEPVKKKKRKKKKDNFCGLNKTAVLSSCNESTQKKEDQGQKKDSVLKKTAVLSLCAERNQRKEEEQKTKNQPSIKYNVIGKLDGNKYKIAEEKLKNKVVKQKSVKDKIMEKKIRKAKLKSKNSVKNLLEVSKNVKTTTSLKKFLKDL